MNVDGFDGIHPRYSEHRKQETHPWITWVLRIRHVDLLRLKLQNSLDLLFVEDTIPIEVVHGEEGLRVEILFIHVILFLPNLFKLSLRVNIFG